MDSLFMVTIRVSGNDPFQVTVRAEDEWKARSKAMIHYPYLIRGKAVEYEVTK